MKRTALALGSLAIVLTGLAVVGALTMFRHVDATRASPPDGALALAIEPVGFLEGLLVFVLASVGLAAAIGHLPAKERARLVSGPLQAERLEDGLRKLLRDLEVTIDGRDDPILIPEGTRTDYSSIPWFARALVRWSRVDIAGVVHDYLYDQGQVMGSRREADRIWRIVALAGDHHANPLQAWLGWLGLRIGGWGAWWVHRRRDREQALAQAEKGSGPHGQPTGGPPPDRASGDAPAGTDPGKPPSA